MLPRLIPWLIQLTLAAQPITGKRWVLWRLRCHTGERTQLLHQLRQSCISAWLSCVMVRCPVRSLRPLDCGWPGKAGTVGSKPFLTVFLSMSTSVTSWYSGTAFQLSLRRRLQITAF